jgi:hypothetical protein
MFEVRYEPPQIFVTKRQTGATYKFLVGNDGAVNDEIRLDQGDARRAAITYLAQRARANAVLSKT